MNKETLDKLNDQIQLEFLASYRYLAIACWAEINGFNGTASFFYSQSEEERTHMLKIVRYVTERDGKVIMPKELDIKDSFNTLSEVFEYFLESEQKVSKAIFELIELADKHNDHFTETFLQWYVTEQREEEAVAKMLVDRVNLLKAHPASLYLIDDYVQTLSDAPQSPEA